MTRSADPDSLGFVLSDAARLMRAAVEKVIGETGFGITPAEARTLIHLSVLERPRQTTVAERMGIEPMTLSGHLDRLETGGFVRREADPHDRRAKIVTLTAEGEALVEAVRPVTRRLFAEVTAGLGEGGGETLRAMLIALRGALQERLSGNG